VSPRRLRSLCTALFVLNSAYCVASLFVEGLPAWKMFQQVRSFDYELRDRAGQAIDVRDYLPRDVHLIDEVQLRRVAQFISEKESARGPFLFRANSSAPRERLTQGRFAAP
jgi:hypothetical protein